MIKKLGYFLLILIATTIAITTDAKAQKTSSIMEGLSKNYQNMESLTASYSRTTITTASEQVFKSGTSQTATGLLTWRRPVSLKFDQETPLKEQMITNGQKVWWHIPSEKLVYYYEDIDVASQIKPLVAFLSGLNELEKEFKVSKTSADKNRPGQIGLLLSPKKNKEMGFDKLTVWCDENFALKGFRINAVTGEVTDFFLNNIKINQPSEDKMFNFKPPKGTKVIYEGEEEGI